jgi:hypothetical protein
MTTKRKLTPEEQALIPFDFLEPSAHISPDDEDPFFLAKWQDKAVYTAYLDGKWFFLEGNQEITAEIYRAGHPGAEHIENFNSNTGKGDYNGKPVRWSNSARQWVYNNNRPVNFDSTDEETVSSILSPIPGSFNEPEAST